MKDHWGQMRDILGKIENLYHIITFLEFESFFQNDGLHFGNVEGVNTLCGKDIAVVGTPHLNEFVYKLIGVHLGINVGCDVLAVRRVMYKGYEFSLMTYKNKELRELQFYFISKELEQCIGRARLLRNDCKVLVFSNFPCEQVELVQDDYLNPDYQEKLSLACGPDLAGNYK